MDRVPQNIADNLNVSSGFTFTQKAVKPTAKENTQKIVKESVEENTSKSSTQETKEKFPPKSKNYPLFSKKREKKHFPQDEKVECKTENVFGSEQVTFKDLNIHDYVIQYLGKKGITKATSIQQQAIPKIFKGDNLMVSIIHYFIWYV